MGSAETDGGAHAIHGGVTAPDDDDVLADPKGRGQAAGKGSAGEVGADEEVGGGVDVVEFFALKLEALTEACAVGKEDGVEGVEVIPGDVRADVDAELEVNASGLEGADFFVDDGFGGFEVGNAVAQDAARLRPGFEDGDRMSEGAKAFGDGETGRSAADDGEARAGFAVGHRDVEPAPLFAVIVCEEGFKFADGDGLAVLADDAASFAEAFLGTEASAEFGKFAGLSENGSGLFEAANFQLGERTGDVVTDRASFGAGRGGALNAALGFKHGRFRRVAEVDLVPVVDALKGGLFGDVMRRNTESSFAVDRSAARVRCVLGHGPLPPRRDRSVALFSVAEAASMFHGYKKKLAVVVRWSIRLLRNTPGR